MDETDTLVRRSDGVMNSGDHRAGDDEAPTVEESYEVTTTRRKTVRTSYKIQEVNRTAAYVYTTSV